MLEVTAVVLNQIMDRYPDEEFLRPEGFDTAIIGVEDGTHRLIYSVTKTLHIIYDEMTSGEDRYIEAVDYFESNVVDGASGGKEPIWCEDDFEI